MLFFPFVALLFTLPYMFVQYRRFGAILFLRTMVVYSFILYMMCMYFLVVLPLPDVETVSNMTGRIIQLVPFTQFSGMIHNAEIVWTDISTYKRVINTPEFFQAIANIVMTIPFGIYMRYYFKCSFRKTLILTFLLTLSFETIQLSGLLGIYPRPYRLADVDDLITNTLGGVIGYLVAPLPMKILPSKEQMDIVSYTRGTQVSVTRRVFAAAIDWILIVIAAIAAVFVLPLGRFRSILLAPQDESTRRILLWFFCVYSIVVMVYFGVGTWIFRGRTIGKWMLHLRTVDRRTDGRPKLWQCLVRYGILYIVVFPAPVIGLTAIMLAQGKRFMMVLAIFGAVILAAIYIVFWLLMAVHVFTHSNQLLHGKLSMTRNISTLSAKHLADEEVKQGTKESI